MLIHKITSRSPGRYFFYFGTGSWLLVADCIPPRLQLTKFKLNNPVLRFFQPVAMRLQQGLFFNVGLIAAAGCHLSFTRGNTPAPLTLGY
jgi:hypothetical protein